MNRKKAYILLILFSFFLIDLKGQEVENPILAIRHVTSWGPDHLDFFPMIAIYSSGTVLIKISNDSFPADDLRHYTIYESVLSKSDVDSLMHHLPLKEFYKLKKSYRPIEEGGIGAITDARTIHISVNYGNERKNVRVYQNFVAKDQNFIYNPKAAKLIYDTLISIRKNIIKSQNLNPWLPKKMELFFIPYSPDLNFAFSIFDTLKTLEWPQFMPNQNSANAYSLYSVSSFKNYFKKDQIGITLLEKDQIDFILKNCSSKFQIVEIDEKKWIISSSFTADNCKFIDYIIYENCMN